MGYLNRVYIVISASRLGGGDHRTPRVDSPTILALGVFYGYGGNHGTQQETI